MEYYRLRNITTKRKGELPPKHHPRGDSIFISLNRKVVFFLSIKSYLVAQGNFYQGNIKRRG